MFSEKCKVSLIISDDKEPKVKVKDGMKIEVAVVSIVDESFKEPTKIAARLCGGTNTCMAIIEV